MNETDLTTLLTPNSQAYVFHYDKASCAFLPGEKEEAPNLALLEPDTAVLLSIAEKTAALTITDSAEYRPEYRCPLLLYYILKEAAGLEITFDLEMLFQSLSSPLGSFIMEQCRVLPFLIKLCRLTDEKISYRKACLAGKDMGAELLALIADKVRDMSPEEFARSAGIDSKETADNSDSVFTER